MYTESELKKHLSGGHFSSLYLVFGEEKMLVKRAAQQIEKKLTGGSFDEFGYHVFDNDSDIGEISLCADMLPFMSERNVIRINDMDADKLRKEDFEALMKIIGSLPETTSVLFVMPTLELTSKTAKAQMKKLISYADKNGVCLELGHRGGLALERDLCKWAKAGGCTMSELTAHTLITYVGEDLNRLNNEMKKLTAYADGSEITPEMIDKLVAKSTDASVYDLFGFIISGNLDKAMHAISVQFYQRVDGVYIVTVLSGAYLDAYRARLGAEAGRSPKEIGEDFSYKNRAWVLGKISGQIRSVSTNSLRKSLDELIDVQTRMVTETVEPQSEVERLVCRLALIAGERSDD